MRKWINNKWNFPEQNDSLFAHVMEDIKKQLWIKLEDKNNLAIPFFHIISS
jgi:hypothetical protein